MLSEKNLEELQLSEEQLAKYKEFEEKEHLLRRTLIKCKICNSAIDPIIKRSDLNKVDPEKMEALEEEIKNKWGDYKIFEEEPENDWKKFIYD